jgi:nitroimidazol reductase NimA-like FMN-containing flavoprotein (pyridoxamine 5'-phosphate oxidase superfamily)
VYVCVCGGVFCRRWNPDLDLEHAKHYTLPLSYALSPQGFYFKMSLYSRRIDALQFVCVRGATKELRASPKQGNHSYKTNILTGLKV